MIEQTYYVGPEALHIVEVNRNHATKIAPNFYWWNLKEAGIEAWLEINVGRLNTDWFVTDGMGDSIAFRNAIDATAFKLRYG